ncbi:hypothetical protein EJ110_NYTH23049 [Nymphaea thermarum]|nr:hypothetical protein EJ110_NYTH23049 [Nymphaea thermarum]
MEWAVDFQVALRAAGFAATPDFSVNDQQEPPCPYSVYSFREQALSEVKRLVYQYEEQELRSFQLLIHSHDSSHSTHQQGEAAPRSCGSLPDSETFSRMTTLCGQGRAQH